MRIKMNNACSNRISLFCAGEEYTVEKGKPIFIETQQNEMDICVKNLRKSIVTISWLDLILQMLAGDGSVTVAQCLYSFTLKAENNCEITLKDLSVSVNEHISYSSLYAVSDKAVIENENYKLNDAKKIIKKHTLLHTFVLSGLPLITALIVITLLLLEGKGVIGVWIGIFLFMCIFTIPSFVSISKFKKYINDSFAEERLLSETVRRRNPDKVVTQTNKGRFERLIEKLLSKMFNLK